MADINIEVSQYVNGTKLLFAEWIKAATLYDSANQQQSDAYERRNIFILDGIASPSQWFCQEIRPLFVLKEAYDDKSRTDCFIIWDEVQCFVNGKAGPIASKTWQKLCEWTHDLFNSPLGSRTACWDDEYLKRIAVINIKKYGGKNPSENKDLERHAIEHSTFIYKQIQLIKPTVIICGYTGWLLEKVWEKEEKRLLRNNPNSRVHDITIAGVQTCLIDFWHPSCRTSHQEEWENDLKAIRDITFRNGSAPNESSQIDESENENENIHEIVDSLRY